jgi:hypothetical protein
MCFFVDVFKLIDGIVGVYLRGSQAAVAQKFLDSIKIGAVIGEVRGECMP